MVKKEDPNVRPRRLRINEIREQIKKGGLSAKESIALKRELAQLMRQENTHVIPGEKMK